jgi:phage shock protein A
MFKMITTLIRGHNHDVMDAVADANAPQILRQQLRDAAAALETSKRGVAVVMAHAAREGKAKAKLEMQLADLERRAVEAIQKDREDLAMDAAAAIADLEAGLNTSKTSLAHYDREVTQLREQVRQSEHRLRNLQRGQHIATATLHTQNLRGTMPNGVVANLNDAEKTLERLQNRQAQAEEVEIALADINATSSVAATSARLAEAGCGAPLRSKAEDVLARLKAQSAASA